MEEEIKKKLHYELIERRVLNRNSQVTLLGFYAVILLLAAAAMLGFGVYNLYSTPINSNIVLNIAALIGTGAFLFGFALLLAILGAASYFDDNNRIAEAEKLYTEAIR